MSRLVTAKTGGPTFSLDHIPVFRRKTASVAPASRAAGAPATGDTARTGEGSEGVDSYSERVAKYIPGEVLAAYLTINGILATVPADEASIQRIVYVVVFLLCLVLTPVYLDRVHATGKEPTRVHLILSTIAFAVWAYSMGGVFQAFGVFIPWLGAVMLAVFTLISGAFIPTKATA